MSKTAAVSTSTMLLMAAAVVAVAAGKAEDHLTDADVGNWTVGDCIMAQFAMELTVLLPNKTVNATATVDQKIDLIVPVKAVADRDQSNCAADGGKKQTLSLFWQDRAANGTDMLNRNITVVFEKLNDTDTPSYGVSRFFGVFEMAHFQQNYTADNKTILLNVTSSVDVDTGDRGDDRVMFRTPLHRSFLCAEVDPFKVASHVHYTFPDWPPQGKVLNDTVVHTKKVQFDAFRPKDAPHKNFQVPMDCDYQPNDIVPIVVGVCLAALVVFVIIAYIIGRRRHRQRGYQSV